MPAGLPGRCALYAITAMQSLLAGGEICNNWALLQPGVIYARSGEAGSGRPAVAARLAAQKAGSGVKAELVLGESGAHKGAEV